MKRTQMADQRLPQSTFTTLLDELIPARDESLPGAGSLGLGEGIESKLGDTTPLVAAGLAALDSKATDLGATSFAEMPTEARVALIPEVAAGHPGFIETLVFHLYTAYYQNPRVIRAIGLKPEPPYPGGYDLEQGDLGLLDPVRGRKRLYRGV
jgi:hypothetical protein